ncbi:MAG: sigma-54 dependent transcriptional regulator [Desulfohalobiaceae bacterium]|nr:sigma-54 dependent transcriptional regulator [Desulfohalobiaceae bacterium]
MPTILIVDDDVQIRRLLEQALKRFEFEIRNAATLGQALELAEQEPVDLLFLDLSLPDGNGLDALERFSNTAASPEIIIVTGNKSQQGAKYALEFGVFDYLQKPLDLDEIRLAAQRALEFRSFRQQQSAVKLFRHDDIIGKNKQLKQCLEATARAAATDSSVLITGETGTGKDLIAKAVHENSPRSEASYIIVDCAALKSSLMESILFGHVKGAYTGAASNHEGRIALAHKGTLFLDEIGELDLDAQKRFLRLLESKRFYPLGSKKPATSEFRLVSATNRNLEQEVEQGRFRSDLYFRIRGQVIHLPPLRQRKDDIRELTFHYMEKMCLEKQIAIKKVYPEFVEALLSYEWPGNIRELVNVLEETISSFPEDPNLQPRHLPAYLRIALRCIEEPPEQTTEQETEQAPDPSLQSRPGFDLVGRETLPPWKTLRQDTLEALEQDYFRELAHRTDGRVKDMARLSGLTQARIYELFKKHPEFFKQA